MLHEHWKFVGVIPRVPLQLTAGGDMQRREGKREVAGRYTWSNVWQVDFVLTTANVVKEHSRRQHSYEIRCMSIVCTCKKADLFWCSS